MLRVEISDDTCRDNNEAYTLELPLETDKTEIIRAIAVLFPSAYSISMEVIE